MVKDRLPGVDVATRRLNRARRSSMMPRRNGIACLESWTLPGRFLRRRMCPVWATCATSG